MRTTIEIRDEYRGKLLEIAARRGEKGVSTRSAVEVLGTLGDETADRLDREIRKLRRSWR